MAFLTTIPGLRFVLEDHEFFVFVVGIDPSQHPGAFNHRGTEGDFPVVGDGKDFAKFGDGIYGDGQLFNV
jgi:hypothetical protein